MQQVYDQITQHPETHQQATWHTQNECGTTSCAAGWAMQFSGYRWAVYDGPTNGFWGAQHKLAYIRPGETVPQRIFGVDGAPSPLTIGQELFRLDDDTAYALFIETTNEEAAHMIKVMLDEDLLAWNEIVKTHEEGLHSGRYMVNLPVNPPWKDEA